MAKATYRWIALMMAAALFAGVGSVQGEEKSAERSAKPEEIAPKPGQVMVLSLQESILLGLKNNLDIAIEGFNPKIKEADVTGEKAVFDPSAFAEIGFNSTQTPNRNVLAGVNVTEIKNDDFNWIMGFRQDLPTGGNYELRFDNNRNFNNSAFFSVVDTNTAYSSDLSLTVTQPLLKNFGVDINRTQIKIAENDREISLDRFHETIMDVVTQIQDVYWDLVFTIEDLKVAERSLRLAQELADLNRARVRAGVAAPVEITQAKADVASREALVTVAEKEVRDAEDRLKVVLNIPKQGEWGGAILPADPAGFSRVTLDLPGAVADALRKRPKYEAAKVDLSNRELNFRFTRNQLLPDLSFQGSVGINGLSALDPSYGDALDDLGSGNNFSYSAGLVFSIPIGNRAARAEFVKAQLEVQQAQVSLRDLELEITAEVREAVRRIEKDAKLVQDTRSTRALREEQLRIEQKRLEAGVSTTFEVLRFQRDLAVAQSAEVRSLTNYNKSIANLDRVRGVVLEKHRIQM
ncbi:MAG: TolC family protein [Candidatus Methylomirabilales bacterium]